MLGRGGGGDVTHPLQLTTGLVINSFVTTSPTLAGEHMLLIPKVSILSEQMFHQLMVAASALHPPDRLTITSLLRCIFVNCTS